MCESLGKILVIRGGAIGDFILTLPVLAALRLHFPRAQVEVLGYPHIVQLALAGGLADQVRSIEARALAGFFAPRNELDGELAGYFASFNLIISYLYDPDEFFRSNVARCSKAQFIIGPHRPDEAIDTHATDVFLRPLERLAIFESDPIPRLRFGSELSPNSDATGASSKCADAPVYGPRLRSRRGKEADRIVNTENPPPCLGGYRDLAPAAQGERLAACLALHPGSGSDRKNWTEEKWAELIGRLAEMTNLNFLLVGGEAEGGRLARLAAVLPNHRTQIAQSLPLVELAHHLQTSAIFAGHDSGISHLAAALGLPGLVLWAHSNLSVWSPRSDRMSILRCEGELAHLPVPRVLEEIIELVNRLSEGPRR